MVQREPEPSLNHLRNHLAVIKLAIQMLNRDAELSVRQRRLARTAVRAADSLADDLSARGDTLPFTATEAGQESRRA